MANPSSTEALQRLVSGPAQPPEPTTCRTNVSTASIATAILLQVVFGSILGIVVYQTLARGKPPNGESDETPVAPVTDSLLHTLWLAGNPNIDPCSDFVHHTCSNHDPNRTPGAVFNALRDSYTVIGKLSRSYAGRLQFGYYQSCIRTLSVYEQSWHDAIRAVLEITAVGTRMSSLHLFSTIVRLNLMYRLDGNIVIKQAPPSSEPVYRGRQRYDHLPQTLYREKSLIVIAEQRDPYLRAIQDPDKIELLALLLTEVQSILTVNVNTRELLVIATELEGASSFELEFSNAASLADIVPGVSTRLWADLVETCTGTKIAAKLLRSPTHVLRHRFSVLLDSARQPATTALVVIEAALSLLKHGLRVANVRGQAVHEFCYSSAFQITVLWQLDVLLRFSANAEHNAAILNTFDMLRGAIRKELETVLKGRDAWIAEQIMRNITLLLPYHIIPLDTRVPVFGENYYHNLLLAREYGITEEHFMLPPALSLQAKQGRTFLVTVPTWLYTAVFVNRTTTLLTSAVFGVYLADKIWAVVFDGEWGKRSLSALERYTHSSRRITTRDDIFDKVISRPHAALRSCVQALSLPQWHELDLHGGASPTSWSQKFYKLVVFYFYCDAFFDNPKRALHWKVQNITQQNEDFVKAFKCGRDQDKLSD
ncbi:hypothetical protein HPB48_016651 [Haemaphysalis longicornis]|uniref:Uncharacterized protein n=1 Tax=Haemaphysalis longicornis TaxID=44386 RepID=A0A9J6FNL2_HAELO|nr:hypothetical protein HPB48_016651 [Haemaphysalis longicornis]